MQIRRISGLLPQWYGQRRQANFPIAYQTRFIKPQHFPPYRYEYSDNDIYLAVIEIDD
jgi:hypothetical protein